MEDLKRQVRQAQRRLAWQSFLGVLAWCWFATLLVAVAGIAVIKIWPLPVDGAVWSAAWIGGALVAGVLVAALWTFIHRRGALDAALEIDRRFGLKERVSSALALDPTEHDTEAGRALVDDAIRRAQKLDVADRFAVKLSQRAWLPLVPALAAFAIALFVTDKAAENAIAASQATAATRAQIKQSTQVLERRLAQRKQEAKEQNLKDAEDLFQKIEDRVRELSKQDQNDRQNAMVKLNDLAKELADRRQQLGADDKLKQQLDQLKNLKERGPADKLADAMKKGDFQRAIEEAKKLEEQLARQDLTQEQKDKLAAQLNEMKDKLEKMAEAHQQMKQDLEQQIAQAREAGKLAEADKLQQQLDKLARQDQQMQRLDQLSKKLGQCAQCMKDGQGAGGKEAMDQLAKELAQMQQESDELAMLDSAMDQIAAAKDAMNCKACQGAGCKECQGGDREGDKDFAKGRGRAQGARGEQKDDTAMYDSKVDQNVRRGAAVVTDMVQGPNIKGQVQQEIKAQLDAAGSQAADPLTGQKLPRSQRDHAQQYFDSLREH